MTAPLSRLMDEQPVFVDDIPVSGRSIPRPEPVPDDFRHELRFDGAIRGVRAHCQPCQWAIWIADGHSLTDLIRLASMHGNPADVAIEVTSCLAQLAGELLAANAPAGAS